MTTALAWFLVSINIVDYTLRYSPPVASLADCERLQQSQIYLLKQAFPNSGHLVRTQCVQLNIMLDKK